MIAYINIIIFNTMTDNIFKTAFSAWYCIMALGNSCLGHIMGSPREYLTVHCFLVISPPERSFSQCSADLQQSQESSLGKSSVFDL